MYKLAGLVLLLVMSTPDHRKNDLERESDLIIKRLWSLLRAVMDNEIVFKLRRKATRDPCRDIYLVDATGSDGSSGIAPQLGCKLWLLKVATNFAFTPTVGCLLKSSAGSGGTLICAHMGYLLQSKSRKSVDLCWQRSDYPLLPLSTLSSRGCCGM